MSFNIFRGGSPMDVYRQRGQVAKPYRIASVERRGEILHSFAIPCMRGVAALNVSMGCAHGCAYCYARAYPEAPPEGEVLLYSDLGRRLAAELDNPRRRRPLPRAVAMSTATDAFQPYPEILESTHQALEVLLGRGIPVTFLTKATIPSKTLGLLGRYPHLLRAGVGLLSLDPDFHLAFERGTAPPSVRLGLIQTLKEMGIPVVVRHDPVVPGITDRPDDLRRLFASLSTMGVEMVDVGFLYLRPGIARLLRAGLPAQMARRVLVSFSSGPVESVAGSDATRLLPPEVRKSSYARIRGIAAEHGIRTALCRCKNPDIPADHCFGSQRLRPVAVPDRSPRQLTFALEYSPTYQADPEAIGP